MTISHPIYTKEGFLAFEAYEHLTVKKDFIQSSKRSFKIDELILDPEDLKILEINGVTPKVSDPINPDYYKRLPVEVIEITEHFDFCLGNALKYIMRAGFKPDNDAIQDLKKAQWYLNRKLTTYAKRNKIQRP